MADMSREDHRKALEKYRDGILSGGISVAYDDLLTALDAAITVLRGWVKTADRLPTAEDANNNLCVLAKVAKDGTVKEVRFEELSWIEWGGAYYFSHWMKLPEVEG